MNISKTIFLKGFQNKKLFHVDENEVQTAEENDE